MVEFDIADVLGVWEVGDYEGISVHFSDYVLHGGFLQNDRDSGHNKI